VATGVVAVLAAVPAVVLVVGDIEYSDLYGSSPSVGAEAVAARLLPWPEPASALAQLYFAAAEHGQPGALAQAVHWGTVAVDRDPANGTLWADLAQYQGATGDVTAFLADAATALRYQPDDAAALVDGGLSEAMAHHRGAAERDLRRSLLVDPDQTQMRTILGYLEQGCTADRRLQFTCPPTRR
jgi:hypothetical protein